MSTHFKTSCTSFKNAKCADVSVLVGSGASKSVRDHVVSSNYTKNAAPVTRWAVPREEKETRDNPDAQGRP